MILLRSSWGTTNVIGERRARGPFPRALRNLSYRFYESVCDKCNAHFGNNTYRTSLDVAVAFTRSIRGVCVGPFDGACRVDDEACGALLAMVQVLRFFSPLICSKG